MSHAPMVACLPNCLRRCFLHYFYFISAKIVVIWALYSVDLLGGSSLLLATFWLPCLACKGIDLLLIPFVMGSLLRSFAA